MPERRRGRWAVHVTHTETPRCVALYMYTNGAQTKIEKGHTNQASRSAETQKKNRARCPCVHAYAVLCVNSLKLREDACTHIASTTRQQVVKGGNALVCHTLVRVVDAFVHLVQPVQALATEIRRVCLHEKGKSTCTIMYTHAHGHMHTQKMPYLDSTHKHRHTRTWHTIPTPFG